MLHDKPAWRRRMRRWRAENPQDCAALLANLAVAVGNADTAIAGYWPLPGEPDLRPLLLAWHAEGRRVLLPRVVARDAPLAFLGWTPATPMLAGDHGTSWPDGPAAVPHTVIVPFLAFSPEGYRLGYGGGYYDRTLAGLPEACRVGCGFAGQETSALPVDAHDVAMDMIVTEKGVLRCGRDHGREAGV